MNELISVIVPVYKVEMYIDRCIKSIVNQTYSNLEIILIDDGSPDNCPDLCDKWANSDSRIKVIHKVNGGLSDARNVGLSVATGEIISFVDSDDWLDLRFYEIMLDAMHEYNCDIVVCGYECVYNYQGNSAKRKQNELIIMNTQEAMEELISDGKIRQVVWNKLYKSYLIKDIPFAIGKYHEDEFWSYQIIGRANTIGVLEYNGYFYFQHSDSIMGADFSEKRLDAIEAICSRQEYLKKNFPQLANRGLVSIHFESLYVGQLALRKLPRKEADIILNRIKDIIAYYPMTIEVIKTRKLSQKIFLVLERISFRATCKLRNLIHIGM